MQSVGGQSYGALHYTGTHRSHLTLGVVGGRYKVVKATFQLHYKCKGVNNLFVELKALPKLHKTHTYIVHGVHYT